MGDFEQLQHDATEMHAQLEAIKRLALGSNHPGVNVGAHELASQILAVIAGNAPLAGQATDPRKGRGESVGPSEASQILASLDRLRAEEGTSVTFFCDNPEFDGRPDCAIEVQGPWTGPEWNVRRFEGGTLIECLARAEAAKDEAEARAKAKLVPGQNIRCRANHNIRAVVSPHPAVLDYRITIAFRSPEVPGIFEVVEEDWEREPEPTPQT